ncbi:cytochrome P450 [Neolentinus lepideus HHB14362 ss-1]|uniref:Cytochrome P450 n=1 Tax=Neolentinus lepideus HHB14362 ss-1 TaxID=1314782 RepID=A0A165T4W0_9AGAM|nr:cytochrome P450 [Neolentinus lepideus HHB14362 ss-1]
MSAMLWDTISLAHDNSFTIYLLVTTAIALILLLRIIRRYSDVNNLPCPPGAEYFWGHERIIFESPASAKFSEWFKNHGPVYRIKGALFHPDIIVLADRVAIYHVFNSHMDSYIIERISGRGITWSEGSLHKRFRKLLEPAFSTATVKSMAQDVFESSDSLERRLSAHLEAQDNHAVVDITHWTASATLDTIGRLGFGYDFRAGESEEAQELLSECAKLGRNAMSTPAFYVCAGTSSSTFT